MRPSEAASFVQALTSLTIASFWMFLFAIVWVYASIIISFVASSTIMNAIVLLMQAILAKMERI